MIQDILDSFFSYIADQAALQNPTNPQVFGGVVEARDWPQTQPIPGALYLLVLGQRNMGGTEDQNYYEITCQWTWFTQGVDIQQDQVAENRAGRYRYGMQIVNTLRNAHYPGFCAKSTTTVDSEGNLTVVPFTSPSEDGGWQMIRWTRPNFMPRQDDKSGILYQSATVRVYGYDSVSPLVSTGAMWPYIPPVHG